MQEFWREQKIMNDENCPILTLERFTFNGYLWFPKVFGLISCMSKSIFFVLLFFCTCCDLGKEINLPNLQTAIAFPLGNATFEPSEFLSKLTSPVTFSTDQNGLLSLNFTTNLQKLSTTQVIGDVDQLFPSFIPLSQPIISHVFSLPSGVHPVSIEFEEGNLQWFIENPYGEKLTVTLSLPFTDYLNIPLTQSFSIPAYSGIGVKPFITNTLSLSGKLIFLKDKKITISYKAEGESGKSYQLPNAAIRLSNLKWRRLITALNAFELDIGPMNKPLDFLFPFYAGQLAFEKPELTLIFEHNFRMPIKISIPYLLIKLPDGKQESIIAFDNYQMFNLGFSPIPTVTRRDSAAMIVHPNPLNTILQKKAISLHFNLKAAFNTSSLPDGIGSIHRNDELLVAARVHIPMTGSLQLYPLSDTIPLDLGILEKVKEGTVRIISNNTMPMSIRGQCYFIDKKGEILDSLMTGGPALLSNPTIPLQGAPPSEIVDFPVSSQKMNVLRTVDRLVVKAYLSTHQQKMPFIQLKKGQQLALKLSLLVQY
jgi:hypothetical protein